MKQKRKGLSLSHFGIFVHDIELMTRFYSEVLEFTITDRGYLKDPTGAPVELVFTSRDPAIHHQIILVTGRPAHLPFNVINQLSLEADSLETLQTFYQTLKAEGVDDLQPISHGNALSLYFRDPEGTRIELFIDTPWYVSQPCREPMPIDLAPDQLMEWAEQHARQLPGFRSRAEWQAEMEHRMRSDSDPVV